jgi:hypothetical protein
MLKTWSSVTAKEGANVRILCFAVNRHVIKEILRSLVLLDLTSYFPTDNLGS